MHAVKLIRIDPLFEAQIRFSDACEPPVPVRSTPDTPTILTEHGTQEVSQRDTIIYRPKRKRAMVNDFSKEQRPGAIDNVSSHPQVTSALEQTAANVTSPNELVELLATQSFGAARTTGTADHVSAAAITTMPTCADSIDCLKSLDSNEPEAGRLAMALFNAEMEWTQQDLQMKIDGISIIIPHSEVTLKGVREVAVYKSFGARTHAVVTESPIRKRELGEGKDRTDCVSMTFTRNRTFINLLRG